ncbi:hypothetical protein AVEN_234293-1 [Araneus ventricosus]|uniref:Uncharacterized protein n=1 Tax=Araneus ventricosus TaxID=182803 RepID=A0A4Y2AAK4_ARAVE|nr:hypothetical protein AVEN_234293-1 [Araneus ventricosus]
MEENKETDDKEEEKEIMMEESDDDAFNAFQQEMKVAEIDSVNSSELDVTDSKRNNLPTSKFVLVVNAQFAISENQIKAILPDPIIEVDDTEDAYVFSDCVNINKKLAE